jgi:hypothetical protein
MKIEGFAWIGRAFCCYFGTYIIAGPYSLKRERLQTEVGIHTKASKNKNDKGI